MIICVLYHFQYNDIEMMKFKTLYEMKPHHGKYTSTYAKTDVSL